MSMHKKPLTPLEEEGLKRHGLPIGEPSQLSDAFRQGMAWQKQQHTTHMVTRPPTRVLVNLHGGAIHDVQADSPAEVLFISNHSSDVAEFMGEDAPALVPTSENMDDPHAWWHHTAEVGREDVKHFFDQAELILKE